MPPASSTTQASLLEIDLGELHSACDVGDRHLGLAPRSASVARTQQRRDGAASSARGCAQHVPAGMVVSIASDSTHHNGDSPPRAVALRDPISVARARRGPRPGGAARYAATGSGRGASSGAAARRRAAAALPGISSAISPPATSTAGADPQRGHEAVDERLRASRSRPRR